jgi:DnaJ homolog subfamily C member 22
VTLAVLMAKSVLVAYVLWAVGGWFGLHHLYLRRDLHAFLTWSTLGGYFGIGLLRDLVRIPEYVADCNNDEKFIKKFVQQLKENEKVLILMNT